MAIRKVETDSNQFEKDIYAVDIDGKVSEVVTARDKFTIDRKNNELANINNQISRLQVSKEIIQADIDAANAL